MSQSSQLGDTRLLWLLLREDGTGVSGQFPTIEIRRHRDWYYIDWDTSTFVDIGGTKTKVMSEHLDNTGFYSFDFNPEHYGETQREFYTVFYRNLNPQYELYTAEDILFEDSSSNMNELDVNIIYIRKILSNKTILRKLGIGRFEQEFYDNDGTSIIKIDDIIKNGNEETRTPR